VPIVAAGLRGQRAESHDVLRARRMLVRTRRVQHAERAAHEGHGHAHRGARALRPAPELRARVERLAALEHGRAAAPDATHSYGVCTPHPGAPVSGCTARCSMWAWLESASSISIGYESVIAAIATSTCENASGSESAISNASVSWLPNESRRASSPRRGEQRAQALGHLVERAAERADLVVAHDRCTRVEIACGDRDGGLADASERRA